MPEQRKWRARNKQQSFDNPEQEKKVDEKQRTSSPNDILSILGKNIGLLSRKHSRERQKKKYEEQVQKKNRSQTKPAKKSGEKPILGNILRFSKSKTNQVTAVATSKETSSSLNKNIQIRIPASKKQNENDRSKKNTETPLNKEEFQKNDITSFAL